MEQVPAISSETPVTSEQNNIQRANDNVPSDPEKEKLKAVIPSMMPINFQSFVDVPLDFGRKLDNAISRINSRPSTHNDILKHDEAVRSGSTVGNPEGAKKETAAKVEEKANSVQMNQTKIENEAINKIFGGEMDISGDFYDSMVAAKDASPSLGKLDIDDLISQIKDKIKFLKDNGKIELSVELKPENLGTVLMNISSNKGVLSINIFADQAAKEVLQDNLKELERSLNLANLNVVGLSVLSDDRKKNSRGEYLSDLLYNNG